MPVNKLVIIATDGATAMQGKQIGLIGLLRDDFQIPLDKLTEFQNRFQDLQ